MSECKYQSFSALAEINDPELLVDVFFQHIDPDQNQQLNITIYEYSENQWFHIRKNGINEPVTNAKTLELLENLPREDESFHCYVEKFESWLFSYKPLTSKVNVLVIQTTADNLLLDNDYVQLLFHFYCHQLQLLKGTYRDALTGLYNRRAFNHKIMQLLGQSDQNKRRINGNQPGSFVMFDIDFFKRINDTFGHLYGDEVLLLLSRVMIDSFRENDLLFRYGGEEFAAVLMDIDPNLTNTILDRFRQKIEQYNFPKIDQVTISIGFTQFDTKLQLDELIAQADKALYYCKQTTRNTVHNYDLLIKDKLIDPVERVPTEEALLF